MIGINELIRLNNNPPAIKDNFNRDSSACKSAKGYVIHSGIHRSTAFVNEVEHKETFEALEYWKAQGQAALNGFIEAIIDGGTVALAEETACKRLLPDWTLSGVASSGKGAGAIVTASRPSGKAIERISGKDWRELAERAQTPQQTPCQAIQAKHKAKGDALK